MSQGITVGWGPLKTAHTTIANVTECVLYATWFSKPFVHIMSLILITTLWGKNSIIVFLLQMRIPRCKEWIHLFKVKWERQKIWLQSLAVNHYTRPWKNSPSWDDMHVKNPAKDRAFGQPRLNNASLAQFSGIFWRSNMMIYNHGSSHHCISFKIYKISCSCSHRPESKFSFPSLSLLVFQNEDFRKNDSSVSQQLDYPKWYWS